MKKIIGLLLIASVTLVSCKKDDVQTTGPGDIMLHFDNVAGTADLALNTDTYSNALGQNYTISKFDYYISNIKLKKADGTEYVVPQAKSYFLVKESDAASQEVELSDVPAGDYNELVFTLGVDSLRCTADISQRTGVLDPATGGLGMYWAWNSGYIFMKMEGTSPVSTAAANKIQYHIGGFGGMTAPTINNIKTISLPFPTGVTAKVAAGKAPEVHMLVDAKKVLNGSVNVNIATKSTIMFDAASVDVANNYKNMFSVDHVHND